MAYSDLDTNQIEENLRDLAGGLKPRHQGTLTAQDDTTISGDTYAHADEGEVIENNRTRINEIEKILVEVGWLSAEA